MLQAALVGLGWWGQHIVKSLQGSDRIRIVHGVDVEPDAVEAFATEFGFAVTESFESVLDDNAIDTVIVATPHGFHEKQVLGAVNAGKQIFCEKPLCLTAEGARRILRACEAKNLILGIGHERRFEDALEEIHARAESGALGTLLNMEINCSYNLFASTSASSWRQDPGHAPAGAFTALGVHMTDFMQTVAGRFEELFAVTAHRSADYSGSDILNLQVKFVSGATGSVCCLASTPFYQRITVFGDRCWIECRETGNVDQPDPSILTWRGIDMEIGERRYARKDTVRANFHEWADAVTGRATYRFTPAELLHNVEILEAILKSANTGLPQRVGGHQVAEPSASVGRDKI